MKALILVALLCISARVAMSRTESGCPAGYYNKNNNQCVACSGNCKVCTTSAIKDCSECSTGFSKWLGDDIGCATNQTSCKAFCDIDSTVICNGCAEGYYNLQNVNKTAIGICDACAGKITNCKTCSDDKTCSACIAAFFYDATAKTCKACSDGCSVCTDAASCTTCKSGYAKTTSNTCKACGTDCSECNADKTAECSKCVSGAFLNATAKTCKVIAGCEEGADDKCTKCSDGFRLKSDGTCIACSGSNVWLCNSTSDTAESIIACKVNFVKTVPGTTTTAVACKSVITGCSAQNSDDKCTACETGRVLHNGACPTCSGQFTGCSSCADGSTTTEGKCVACNAIGYFNGGTATAVSCSTCPANCQSCTNATTCTACAANSHNTGTAPTVTCTLCDINATGCTDQLNVSGCKAGFISGSVDICRACKDSQCKTCTTYDTCTVCNDGHSVQNGGCVKCDINCTKNTPACSANGKDKCDGDTMCDNANGYYLVNTATDSTKANTCAKCDANCTVACTAKGMGCTAAGCKDGYGLDTTTFVCKPCKDTNCNLCKADYNTCTTGGCKDGFVINAATPVGCTACTAADCKTCAIGTLTECTACIAGSGKFPEAAADGNGKKNCKAPGTIITGCITYSSATACSQCTAGKNPAASGADCNTVCLAAANCLTCDTLATPATCTTCAAGKYVSTGTNKYCFSCHADCKTGQCLDQQADSLCTAGQCKDGYGKRAAATNICSKCPSNCLTCDASATICDSCMAGFIFKYDKTDCGNTKPAGCLTTVTGDNATAGTGYDQCNVCMDGFMQSTDKKTCIACGSGCKTCTSATVCTNCLAQFVKVGDICSACASNCATCSAAGGCDTCNTGYLYDGTAKVCNPCSSNCAGCTVKDTCDGGTCQGAWGKTSGITKKQTLCFECPTNCATCTVDTKQVTSCTKCVAGYYLDAAKVCTKAGDDKCLLADGTNCTKCKYGFKFVSGQAGCTDCILDKTCTKQCSAGSTVVTPGTSNVTTTTTDDSSTILVFNAIILTILGFITHLLI